MSESTIIDFTTSKRTPGDWIASLADVAKPSDNPASHISLVRLSSPAVKRPTLTYFEPNVSSRRSDTADFHEPEYNMIDPGTIEDIESYIYQGNLKKLALAVKEGWALVGKNKQTTEYIKKRFSQLEIAQGQTMFGLFSEIISTLLRWHNCYILKVRDPEASGGKVRSVNGKIIKPVAGYFVASPNTIKTRIGKDYKVSAYKHVMPDGRFKIFPADDVIHLHIFKKPHFITAAPPITPMADDVAALRRIEEHVENLVYQHIYPLYQYKIGTKDYPDVRRTENGLTEIESVENKLRNAPTDSMLVTSFRHEITGIGAESRALRAEPFLEYFKKRVITGTSLSEIDFGDGNTANRACYSEDTQTLTENGWKYYWEIEEEEKIATFNPKTNGLEYHKPEGGIYLYDYEGPMHHFKNKNVDVLVTPEHDMWALMNQFQNPRWEKIQAKSLTGHRFSFRTGGINWEGIEPENFLLPFVPYKSNIKFENCIRFDRINIYDWLEFLGYYVSEGHLVKGAWRVELSQSETINPAKTEKIRACLRRLPFKFCENHDSDGMVRFRINCKSLYLYLEEVCGDYSYLKHFPSEILSYSKEYLRVAFEAAMLGDGTTDIREGRTNRAYSSTSEMLLDQMQEIAIKLGYKAHIIRSGVPRVSISESETSMVKQDQVEITNYSGKVYCYRVPNHLFITRRNGRIGIHGNTATVLSNLAIGIVKFYQLCLSNDLNFHIIRELLLESTFTFDVLSEENMVELQFKEIDLEAQVKKQNHFALLYQNNLISHTEARMLAGFDVLAPDQESDMFQERVKIPEIEQAAKAQAQNRQQPTNQFGTASGPSASKSSLEPSFTFRDDLGNDLYSDLTDDLHNLNKKQVDLNFVRQLFLSTKDQILIKLAPKLEQEVFHGARGLRIDNNLLIRLSAINRAMFRDLEQDVERLIRETLVKTSAELAIGKRDNLSIDTLQFRMRFIERSRKHQAYILGKMAALDANGINEVSIACEPDGEHYNIWHNTVIGVKNPDLDLLPFSRANCRCDIVPIRRDANV